VRAYTSRAKGRRSSPASGARSPGHFVHGVAGQYQQASAPLGGGLVKPAWFARYRAEELPRQFERMVASWDTAGAPKRLKPGSKPQAAEEPIGTRTRSAEISSRKRHLPIGMAYRGCRASPGQLAPAVDG
jgi:hypothetical protein